MLPGLAFAAAFNVAAPLAGGWYAFTDWNGLGKANWVGLENFSEILAHPTTLKALLNTLTLAGLFLVIVNVTGLCLALALNRALKTRNILRSIFFLPAVLSPLATAYVWRYIFDFNGWLNRVLGFIGRESWQRPWLGDPDFAIWTILVALVWHYSGLAMVIYLAGLQAIPDELDEAAAVDGAPIWMRFRRITFPLLAPAFTLNATLMTIYGLRVFDEVVALTDGGPVYATETLATQVWRQTFAFGRFGYGAALALLLSALVAVAVVIQLVILRTRESRAY